MIAPPLPPDEGTRLQLLRALEILDTPPEEAYDSLTALAAEICEVPIALVSLVDRDRQWFKSRYGLEAPETPREVAFCAHAILDDGLLVVEDAENDPRFVGNPLVTGDPLVKFYAGAPLALSGGEKLGTLCVIDHRPRSLSEAQRRALLTLSQQVVRLFELRGALLARQDLDRSKDEFITMVSHELRTPLTGVFGALRLLQARPEIQAIEAIHTLVDLATRNASRLNTLAERVVDLAAIRAHGVSLICSPQALEPLLAGCIDEIKSHSEALGCEFVFEPSGAAELVVDADALRLGQVISNLLSNAARASSPGQRVTLGLERRRHSVRIWVRDQGSGVPDSMREVLFTEFARADIAYPRISPGAGIGLAVSQKIIEAHGGELSFTSTEGGGSTFFVELPLLSGDERPSASAEPR